MFAMDTQTDLSDTRSPQDPRSPWNVWIAAIVVLVTGAALGTVTWLVLTNSNPTSVTTTVPLTTTPVGGYPIGTSSVSEKSRKGPPGPKSLPDYTLAYVNTFNGTSLPPGWDAFGGVPGGDPGAQFAATHTVVNGGLLRLNTWKDAAYHKKWVTGGVCQCGLARKYGAYFVRSRITGPGPNEVELLWPASNIWPPEIDFSETGEITSGISSTLHFGATNHIDQLSLRIRMTQWHTWGVVWTPTSVTYVVDGRAWGSINRASEIPHQPMTLDLEQRTMCDSHRDCPTRPVSMLVDWVAEYTAK